MNDRPGYPNTISKPFFLVACLECGKKFSAKTVIPTCPQCGGSDVEPR